MLGPFRSELTDSRLETQIIQHSRPDFPRQPVQFNAHLPCDVQQWGSARSELAPGDRAIFERCETQLKQGQRLADIVVQFAGNSPALGFLLRKHSAQYVRQFGFGDGAPLSFKLQFGNSRSGLSQAPPEFDDVLRLARGIAHRAIENHRVEFAFRQIVIGADFGRGGVNRGVAIRRQQNDRLHHALLARVADEIKSAIWTKFEVNQVDIVLVKLQRGEPFRVARSPVETVTPR